MRRNVRLMRNSFILLDYSLHNLYKAEPQLLFCVQDVTLSRQEARKAVKKILGKGSVLVVSGKMVMGFRDHSL